MSGRFDKAAIISVLTQAGKAAQASTEGNGKESSMTALKVGRMIQDLLDIMQSTSPIAEGLLTQQC